jgi:acyl-coenzyme A thioesterase 13
VKFEIDIQKEHTNRLNILHGGTIASMTDLGGSLAVASRGLFSTGVSTDLSVTYLSSGGKIGDLVKAEVTCDKCMLPSPFPLIVYTWVFDQCNVVGKTMAFTSIQFKNDKDQVFARGSHTKYIALAQKDPKNIVEELTPKSEKKE